MSTTIQLTQEYPTIELSYGADFVSGQIEIRSGGEVVDLSDHDLLWQFRTGRTQTAPLVAEVGTGGSSAGCSLTVTPLTGVLAAYIPFARIADADLTVTSKIWHDLRVVDPLGRAFYWWRGVILLVPNITDTEG